MFYTLGRITAASRSQTWSTSRLCARFDKVGIGRIFKKIGGGGRFYSRHDFFIHATNVIRIEFTRLSKKQLYIRYIVYPQIMVRLCRDGMGKFRAVPAKKT